MIQIDPAHPARPDLSTDYYVNEDVKVAGDMRNFYGVALRAGAAACVSGDRVVSRMFCTPHLGASAS